MIRRITRWLFNVSSGYDCGVDEKCFRCGSPATEKFFVGMCADTSIHKNTWISLCLRCDLDLNLSSLIFLYGDTPEVREMMRVYGEEKMAL